VISDALAFIHARKWLVELILLAVIVAGVYFFCQHLIGVGVQRQKDADARELVKLQHDADVEAARLRGVADAAEKARAKEHDELADYRRLHPLHGGLCLNQGGRHLPTAGAADGGDEGTSATAGNLQPLPAGDPGSGGQGDPDVRHLLDVFAGRADLLSAELREYQARATP
jgi:hypothetical protein